jgi:tRNA-modifying protein YgfZ
VGSPTHDKVRGKPYRAVTSRVHNGLCSWTTSLLAYGQYAQHPPHLAKKYPQVDERGCSWSGSGRDASTMDGMRIDDRGRAAGHQAATAAGQAATVQDRAVAPLGEHSRGEPTRRVQRPDLAAIELHGRDTLRYLHTVTSQHLSDRDNGEATAGLLLSPKGKIEFAFRVAVLPGTGGTDPGAPPGRVVIDTEAAAAEDLAERLARFVFRFDVQVGAPIVGGLTLLGPDAGSLAAAAGLPLPPDAGHAAERPGPDWVVVHRTALGLDLVGPGAAALASAPPIAGAVPEEAPALETLRVQHGIPRWGRELTDDVIAEEAGLLGSHVHLDKGCYPGQETVARVHNLGQVQRRLAGLLLEGEHAAPFRADLVTEDGRRAGQVRSSVTHPTLGPIALAYVRRAVASGQRVSAGDIAATVVELPFQAPR